MNVARKIARCVVKEAAQVHRGVEKRYSKSPVAIMASARFESRSEHLYLTISCPPARLHLQCSLPPGSRQRDALLPSPPFNACHTLYTPDGPSVIPTEQTKASLCNRRGTRANSCRRERSVHATRKEASLCRIISAQFGCGTATPIYSGLASSCWPRPVRRWRQRGSTT